MNYSLKADYEGMQTNAVEITNAAKEYVNNVNVLYQEVDKLADYWKGTDKMSYSNTVNSYKGMLTKLGDAVNEFSSFLKMAAKKISETQDDIGNRAGRL